MQTKVRIKIVQFAYNGTSGFPQVNSGLLPWLIDTVRLVDDHPYLGKDSLGFKVYSDTPITMTRNQAVVEARNEGYDFIFMLDSDNWPDFFKNEPGQVANSLIAFLEFAVPRLQKGLPTVMAAPYCGPPPDPHNFKGENIYAFHWERYEHGNPNAPFALEQYTIKEAAKMSGIHPAGAAATGVMLCSLNAFDLLNPKDGGYFYYEWTDQYCQQKASTEDVTFTRNFSMASQQKFGENCLFIHWDAWAAHIKSKVVGKPRPIHVGDITQSFRDAVENSTDRGDRLRHADFGIPKSSVTIPFDTRIPTGPPERLIRRENRYGKSVAEAMEFASAALGSPTTGLNGKPEGYRFQLEPCDIPKTIGAINGRPVWLREQDAKDYIASQIEAGATFEDDRKEDHSKEIESGAIDPLVRHETICGRSFMNLGWETGQADMEGIQQAARFMETLMDRPVRVLEVGSWCGASAVAFATGFQHPESCVWCVDTWQGSPADQTGTWVLHGAEPRRLFDQNTQDLQESSVVRPILGESSAVAARFQSSEQLDLIYIDSGHTRSEVERDIDCWWRHLHPNGVMMFHDYDDPGHPAVKAVLDERFGSVLQKFPGTRLAFVVKSDVEKEQADGAAEELPAGAA